MMFRHLFNILEDDFASEGMSNHSIRGASLLRPDGHHVCQDEIIISIECR